MPKDLEQKTKKVNNNLASAFKKFNVSIKEQSAVGVNNYFKNISKNAVFLVILFISLLSFSFLGYYDVFFGIEDRFFDINIVKTAFYLPLVTMLCLTLFLVKPKYVFRNLYYIIPLIFIVYTSAYFIPIQIVQFILISVMGLIFGYVFASMIYIFFFYFNSKELLCGSIVFVTFMCLFTAIYKLILVTNLPIAIFRYVIPVLLLIISFVMLLLRPEIEFDEVEETEEKVPKSNLIVIMILLAFLFINEGIFYGIKDNLVAIGTPLGLNANVLGFLISLIYIVLIYILSSKANFIMIISYMICVLATYEFGIIYLLFDKGEFVRHIFEGAMGITSPIGIVALIMSVGKQLEDRKNLTTVRNIAFVVACYFVLSRVIAFGVAKLDLKLTFVISIFVMSFLVAIAFLFNAKAVLVQKEEDDKSKSPQYVDPDIVLTKKEKIVFELLLEGLTLRQIAGELSCKYDAVNFHYKNIYRKLNVNSKIDLILRYSKKL